MLTIEQRVQNGIDLLDAKGPKDWRKKIDTKTLCIQSSRKCILAQVFEDVGNLSGFLIGYCKLSAPNCKDNGFARSDDDHSGLKVQAEWIRRLTEETTRNDWPI